MLLEYAHMTVDEVRSQEGQPEGGRGNQLYRVHRHQTTLSSFFSKQSQVLRQLFAPLGLTDPPSAFETSGHVAHLNLREVRLWGAAV